jgi:hypothetical protein
MTAFSFDEFKALFAQIGSLDDDDWGIVLDRLEETKDKKVLDEIAEELINILNQERNSEIQKYLIDALGTIRRGKKVLRKYTSFRTISNSWVRRHAVAALAKTSDNDQLFQELQALIRYEEDEAPVRTVALRILVQNGYEKGFARQLEEMFQDPSTQTLACEAFRQDFNAGGTFSDEMIAKFSDLLIGKLFDAEAPDDCQEEAVWALTELEKEYSNIEPLDKLGNTFAKVLETTEKATLKKACVKSIGWAPFPDAAPALAILLDDPDSEVYKLALQTLSNLLGRDGATNIVVKNLLMDKSLSVEGMDRYTEALRKLDPNLAFQLLVDYLDLETEDAKKERITRVLNALVDLFPPLRLSSRRKDAFDSYTSFLEQTNRELIGQFQHLKWQTSIAYSSHIGIFVLTSLITISVLIYSLYRAFNNTPSNENFSFQVGAAVVSLIVLFILFARNPLASSRKTLTDISKSAIILMGYLRQINQVDAAFKQYVMNVDEFEPEGVEKTIKYLQTAMEGSIDGLSEALEEFKF